MSLSLFVVEPEIFITALLIIIFSYLVMVFTVKKRLENYSKIIKKRTIKQIQSTQEAIGSLVNIKLDKTYKKFINDFKSIEIPLRRIIANSIFLSQFPKLLIEGLSLILLIILSYILLNQNNSENILQKLEY